MATENQILKTTIAAGADYSGTGTIYHAFCLGDGQIANNSEEASGILLNKPESGAFAAVGYFGEMKFAAGGAISKGQKLTITTSGWFLAADSFDTVVGEAKAAVTSGSVGTGFFNFPTITDRTTALSMSVTPKSDFITGTAYCLGDNLQANDGKEAMGVIFSALTSGTAADIVIFGKVQVRSDPAKVCSAGDLLTVTTSGYFIPCGSGYFSCARALANIGSNANGDAFFFGGGPGYDHP